MIGRFKGRNICTNQKSLQKMLDNKVKIKKKCTFKVIV